MSRLMEKYLELTKLTEKEIKELNQLKKDLDKNTDDFLKLEKSINEMYDQICLEK